MEGTKCVCRVINCNTLLFITSSYFNKLWTYLLLSANKMTLMRRHCLFLLTCMKFKSLSDVIKDTLFNKMHELSVNPLLETITQLLKSQQYRVYMALFNSQEVCNLTLYWPLRSILAQLYCNN